MSISTLFSGFSFAKELPKVGVYAGFGVLIGFLIFGKGCSSNTPQKIEQIRSSATAVVHDSISGYDLDSVKSSWLDSVQQANGLKRTVEYIYLDTNGRDIVCAFTLNKSDTTLFTDSIRFAGKWYTVRRAVGVHRFGIIDCINQKIFGDSIAFSFEAPTIETQSPDSSGEGQGRGSTLLTDFTLNPIIKKLFNYDISASVGSGFGMPVIASGNISATFFGQYEIGLQPIAFYRDGLKGALIGQFTYHFVKQ